MRMINRSSAKKKGRLFQKEIAEYLLNCYKNVYEGLESRDIVSTPASVNGIDIILSDKAKTIIPFDCELKNQERLELWNSIKQCETNSDKNRIPLLIFKRNRSDVYACLKLKDLIKLDIGCDTDE